MNEFFRYVRRHKKDILDRFYDPYTYCSTLVSNIDSMGLPENIRDLLYKAQPDERDYAISTAYALLMNADQRKNLSAYFTPPTLVSAVLDAAGCFLDQAKNPTVLDPACGGGSFLTPVTRYLVDMNYQRHISRSEACQRALRNIMGIEIDDGLASLSQRLLRQMLAREYKFRRRGPLGIVKHGDALTFSMKHKFDLVIGNPPYGKVYDRLEDKILQASGRANIRGHTNLYSLFILRGLNWVKPGGGLVFVLPTSFVAGPYFTGLRNEIFRRAIVERIDLHEQREKLFMGAVQDICLLVLRRRTEGGEGDDEASHTYELGYIDANGVRNRQGTGLARSEGEPWTLPVAHEVRVFLGNTASTRSNSGKAFTLSNYGYRVRVGKVVPTRERDRLHMTRRRGDVPLLWASSIQPDGSFIFQAARRLGNALWYRPRTRDRIRYASNRPAVIVQRTSNRDQTRRLYAAMVPKRFRNKHTSGFVAENHVIVLEAMSGRPAIAPSILVKVLNSSVTNERFSAVSGSFSVSAKLLERFALPDPASVKKLDANSFEHGLRKLFDKLSEVLASSQSSDVACNIENAVDKSRYLDSSLTVNENSRFKRGAVA